MYPQPQQVVYVQPQPQLVQHVPQQSVVFTTNPMQPTPVQMPQPQVTQYIQQPMAPQTVQLPVIPMNVQTQPVVYHPQTPVTPMQTTFSSHTSLQGQLSLHSQPSITPVGGSPVGTPVQNVPRPQFGHVPSMSLQSNVSNTMASTSNTEKSKVIEIDRKGRVLMGAEHLGTWGKVFFYVTVLDVLVDMAILIWLLHLINTLSVPGCCGAVYTKSTDWPSDDTFLPECSLKYLGKSNKLNKNGDNICMVGTTVCDHWYTTGANYTIAKCVEILDPTYDLKEICSSKKLHSEEEFTRTFVVVLGVFKFFGGFLSLVQVVYEYTNGKPCCNKVCLICYWIFLGSLIIFSNLFFWIYTSLSFVDLWETTPTGSTGRAIRNQCNYRNDFMVHDYRDYSKNAATPFVTDIVLTCLSIVGWIYKCFRCKKKRTLKKEAKKAMQEGSVVYSTTQN